MSKPIIVSAHGAEIPALGLGTWRLDGDGAVKAVAAALAAGYRHIDTAAAYGNEQAVGEGLRAGGLSRNEVFVTTKVWPSDIAEGDLQRSAETSLKRLGLDAVDLLLIHWPNPAIPLEGSLRGLADARRRGLARHVGVSNFPSALLDRAVAACPEPLVANQCEYHPYLDQSKVRAACARHGIAFVSYSPLGRSQVLEEPAVRAIAERVGRSPAQVVLRWHVQQPGTVAIPKSSHPDRIASNFAIWDFELSEADMAAISSLARPDGRMVNPGSPPDWD